MKKLKTEDKIAVLELAKKKLGHGGKNWIKGTWFGRDRYMDDYGPLARSEAPWKEATCFCLEGAIELAAYELHLKPKPQEGDVATAAVSVRDYVNENTWHSTVHGFNDNRSTDWKDVLRVINGRLKQLRKELKS